MNFCEFRLRLGFEFYCLLRSSFNYHCDSFRRMSYGSFVSMYESCLSSLCSCFELSESENEDFYFSDYVSSCLLYYLDLSFSVNRFNSLYKLLRGCDSSFILSGCIA